MQSGAWAGTQSITHKKEETYPPRPSPRIVNNVISSTVFAPGTKAEPQGAAGAEAGQSI